MVFNFMHGEGKNLPIESELFSRNGFLSHKRWQFNSRIYMYIALDFFFLDDRENIIVQQKTSVLHKTISSLCKRHLKEWFRIIKNYQTRTNWLKQYLMCKGQVRVQPSTLATIVLKINFLDFHLTIEPNFKVYDKCWNDQCKCSIFFLCLKIN